MGSMYTHTHTHTHTHKYIYIYIYIYKITSKCYSQTIPSSSGDSQGSETFLAPSADNQIRNYDTECSYTVYVIIIYVFICI